MTELYPRPLRGLLPYLTQSPMAFVMVILSGILFSGLMITTPAVGAWLVGAVLTGRSTADLTPVLWLLGGLAALTAMAAWFQSYVAHDWAFRILAGMRVRVYDGLERAAPGRILGKRTGDLTASAMSDVETTELFFAHTAGDYAGAVLISVASLGAIAAFDPRTALVTAGLMICVAVVPFVLARRAGEQGRALRGELGALNAETLDGVQGLRELVVFGRGRWYLSRLTQRTRDVHRKGTAYSRRSALEQAASDLLVSLGVIVVPLVASLRVTSGALDPVWLPVLIVLGVASLGPIAMVSATARTLGDVRAAAGRVLAIINYPAQVADSPAAVAGPVEPEVRFENVRFRYAADGPDVLDGVGFTVRPGETVALVGRSGAGKTTCANLLLRFWDTTSGRVLIGGRDVRDLPLDALRDTVTLVPQDVYLFNESIRDNIRLARPEATDDEVEAAARQAIAHDFIAVLPAGYDTMAGERGTQLSGGQRQRIAIARALLGHAPIIVLDEAVSNLDTENERAVQRAFAAVRAQHTTITIAHRLSTIRAADRVIFLADGRVADSGPHEELLARNAEYRQLLATQATGSTS